MKKLILLFVLSGFAFVSCSKSTPSQPELAYKHDGEVHTVNDEQLAKYFSSLIDGPSDFSDFNIVEEEGVHTIQASSVVNGKELTQISLLLEKSEDGKYFLISGNTCMCVTKCDDGSKQIVTRKGKGCGCFECQENIEVTKNNTQADEDYLHNVLKS